jgi:hypothetical protein
MNENAARTVGFTGTRQGMTPEQRVEVTLLLAKADYLRHGDCVGADAQVHEIARAFDIRIILHPPKDPSYRAFCKFAWKVRPEKGYLTRNRDIVHGADLVIAAPKSEKEEMRGSGTWMVIRYATRVGTPLVVVYPDGRREVKNRGEADKEDRVRP